MQVRNLSNSIAQKYGNTAKAIDEVYGESSGKKGENLSTGSTIHLEKARIASDIAKKYGSFRDISPREMTSLGRELYENGIISLNDYTVLSHQPELERNHDTKLDPDQKKDYVELWRQQYLSDRRKGNFKGMEVSGGIHNILNNLQSLVNTEYKAA